LTYLSESDEWETPAEIFVFLINKYKFNPTLDVCATMHNSMLDKFYSIDDYSTNKKWDKANWCNPPNSKPNKELFMKKAHEEFTENQNETLMIIPADTLCTVYAKQYVLDPMYHFEPITRRIRFLMDGEEIDNSKKGYFSVFFGKSHLVN
jgi:phage N-6-adenine-methyltransferase